MPLNRWIRGLGIGIGTAIALGCFAVRPTLAQEATLSEKIVAMEEDLEAEFETYFGRDLAEVTQAPAEMARTLARMGAETGTNPAVLWVMPRETHLHLVLIMPNGEPIVRDLYDVPEHKLREVVNQFTKSVTSPRNAVNLVAAQTLYDWIIEPFAAEFLEPEDIDTLLFCLGDGLRGVPLAALHDGDRFLIEKYSLTRIPAFNLINHDYQDIRQGKLLAVGASEFADLPPLPAVPVELKTVLNQLRAFTPVAESWSELSFVDEDFTQGNFRAALGARDFDLVHLASHADFQPGDPSASYIKFTDGRLSLAGMNELPWREADVDLLVLSACRTALGDGEAELGFAGLALNAGINSAIATLWYISDAGTLAFMGDFYQELSLSPTKAEALRQTQIKMLRGKIRLGRAQLQLSRGQTVFLPENLRETLPDNVDLSHPYFWAGFSLMSSPW